MMHTMGHFGNLAAVVFALLFAGCQSLVPLPEAKQKVAEYYTSGNYERDVTKIMKQAERFLPLANGYNTIGSAVVFDIDDTVLNTYEYQKGMGFGAYGVTWHQWIDMKRATAIKPVLDFYNLALMRGVAVFFISGRREKYRESTEENLRKAGFAGWKDLYLKPDDFAKGASLSELKTAYRQKIEAQGYKIILNIGDHDSDLEGGHALHTVLLPNYIY